MNAKERKAGRKVGERDGEQSFNKTDKWPTVYIHVTQNKNMGNYNLGRFLIMQIYLMVMAP